MDKSIDQKRFLQQLSFIKEIDKLKYIKRKTRLFNSDRHENDAEHSWHLAMMVLVLAEYANEQVDILKVLQMVLIHDLVEIDAGDTFLFDAANRDQAYESELQAAKRIFGILPQEQTEQYLNVWIEFEEGLSKEARFAKAVDRFEPVLQNVSNDGGTWAEFEIPLDKIYHRLSSMNSGSNVLWEHTQELIQELVDQEILVAAKAKS